MTKSLVIVESPAKAKTISKYLGPEYIVESSVGLFQRKAALIEQDLLYQKTSVQRKKPDKRKSTLEKV